MGEPVSLSVSSAGPQDQAIMIGRGICSKWARHWGRLVLDDDARGGFSWPGSDTGTVTPPFDPASS